MVNVRMTAWVRGRVQVAGPSGEPELECTGAGPPAEADALDDGRVEVVAEGPREACEALLGLLRAGGTPGHVQTVVEQWSEPRGAEGFLER